MKRFMKAFVLVAAAAMALTSCENEVMDSVQENDTYTLTFVADAPEGTRTSVSIIGDDETKTAKFAWSAEETFVVLENGVSASSVTYKKNSEGKAEISATFTGDAAAELNYVAVSPASAWVTNDNDNVEAAKVIFKDSQTLTEDSYDPNADLLISKMITTNARPTEAQLLQFQRLVAVGQMNILNLQTEGTEIITSVSFETGNTVLAGSSEVNLTTGEVVEHAYDGASNKVELNGEMTVDATNGNQVYFTCIPATLATGETYTIVVTTDKAVYTKTGEIGANALTFTAGNVRGFKVNMTEAERVAKSESNAAWVKVNYLSELTEGTKIALVGTTNSGSYSMKTNAAEDAPTIVSVSFDGDNLAETSINAISTFVVGVDGSNYILYGDDTKASWLYCISSNNGVRLGDNTNKTFAIAAHTNNGSNWQIKHVGTGRFVGIYNDEDWRCYTTVNATNFTKDTGTSDIAIYRYSEDGTSTPALLDRELAFSSESVNIKLSEKDDFTAPTLSGATDGATDGVTYSSSNTEVATVDASTGAVKIVGAGTTIITASAEADDTYKAGEASYTITVAQDSIEAITIAEFLDKTEDDTVYYELTGEISNIVNTEYGNFTITDETGSVYVYGLTETQKEYNDKSFASLGLAEGDIVTLIGTRDSFNDSAQVGGPAYYVSHEANPTPRIVSVSSDALSFTYEGGSQNVTVEVAGDTATLSASADQAWVSTSVSGTAVAISVAENAGEAREATVTLTYGETTATVAISQTAKPSGNTVYFEKLTSAPSDWSGTYLIVYEGGKVAFNGGLTTLDAVSNTVSVTISDSKIEATDAMKAAAFTINASGHIKSASGYYVGQTSNANGLKANKTTTYKNTLSVNSDGSVNAVSGGAYLRYNATSGQTRFRYFKSSTYTNQKAIHFYKLAE